MTESKISRRKFLQNNPLGFIGTGLSGRDSYAMTHASEKKEAIHLIDRVQVPVAARVWN
ncbi:MAG: hypothetical protein JW896_01890 [Deltaproteobacteria bacterium]|nr:hypothetical protein [Deltaproteobacteria bacterium]